jgi:hypothetical protein
MSNSMNRTESQRRAQRANRPFGNNGGWSTSPSIATGRPISAGTRPGNAYQSLADITELTNDIPYDCPCSWVVVRVMTHLTPALSRLKYPTMICRHHHQLAVGG